MTQPRRAYCEEDVIVDFILPDGANTIEDMEIMIYHQDKDDYGGFEIYLIGNLQICQERTLYESIPDDPFSKERLYYLIGVDCVKRVQQYPRAILG